MKIKKSEIIWNITKETELSIIIALVAYILLSPLLIAIIYPDDPPGHRDFAPLYYCITIIYAISFYLIYIKKSSENAALETINKFDAVEDLKKYIKGDGKILLIYYAVMLVLYTIGNLFLPIGNPLTFIFCFPFAISQNIPIPVLSEIVAYIIEMALILLLTVHQHYKTYQHWNIKKS